jgi:hypothetical protein
MIFKIKCQFKWAYLVLTIGVFGCGGSPKLPVYENTEGFRIVPPTGWVERARDESFNAKALPKKHNLPMAPLGIRECLLVRYDRLISGNSAWLRVTNDELPASTSPRNYVVDHGPGSGWKSEAVPEDIEVYKLPAARAAFLGRWDNQNYVNEVVAVRQNEQVYLISASFPASDLEARDLVRQAVDGASWK